MLRQRASFIYDLSEKIPAGGCGVEDQKQRHENVELCLARFVVRDEHAEKTPQTAADCCNQKKRPLGQQGCS